MKAFQIIISAITTFFIVGGGSMGAVLVALAGQPLNRSAIAVCILTGLVAAMKDVRSTMALPPLSNGNYEAIAQMVRTTSAAQFQAKKDEIKAADQTTKTP